MKKLIFLISVFFTLSMFSQNVLTITVENATTYIINGSSSGDILIASEVDANTVRLKNSTLGSSSDYKTKSGFTDFLIDGINPSNVHDAVVRINIITHPSSGGEPIFDNRIIVKLKEDFSPVDCTKQYFLDGIIDMSTTSIEVPACGINISGYDFNISGLTSTADNYVLFTSPVGGSGDILMNDFFIDISGTNSKVYDLISNDGFKAIEMDKINYNNCTSLGVVNNYRQGLETGTGRFGGSPSMELDGVWTGGFRITTSIVRTLDAGMTEPLFKAGATFQMQSRFLTDINIDLPALAPFFDFSSSNFPNSGTLQIKNAEVTRNGIYDSSDSNLTPNMNETELASYWKGNNGIGNTFVGGATQMTVESETTISSNLVYYPFSGTFTGTGLEHFSSTSDGKLTHLGNSPVEYEISSNMIVEGTQFEEISVRFQKWDNSESLFVELPFTEQTRNVNNIAGGTDVAFFTILTGVTLDTDDFIWLNVRNRTSTDNVTLLNSSFFRIQER